jgi:hypothetical protein
MQAFQEMDLVPSPWWNECEKRKPMCIDLFLSGTHICTTSIEGTLHLGVGGIKPILASIAPAAFSKEMGSMTSVARRDGNH